jgi:hypothetical protein
MLLAFKVPPKVGFEDKATDPLPVAVVVPVPPIPTAKIPEVILDALLPYGLPFNNNEPMKLMLLAFKVPPKVGFEDKTTDPVPVAVVVPVPPIPTARIPEVTLDALIDGVNGLPLLSNDPIILILLAFKVPPKVGFVERATDPVPVAVVVPVPPIPIDKIPEVILDALIVNGLPLLSNEPMKLMLLAFKVPPKVGFEDKTTDPVPVAVVVPVPPIPMDKTPEVILDALIDGVNGLPLLSNDPIILILLAFKVPPKVGFVARTTDPVPVAVVVPVPPIPMDKIPEVTLDALIVNGLPLLSNEPMKLMLLAFKVPPKVGFEDRATDPVPVALVVPVPPIPTARIPEVTLDALIDGVKGVPLLNNDPIILILFAFKVPPKVGFEDRATDPVPVAVVVPVPPIPIDKIPEVTLDALIDGVKGVPLINNAPEKLILLAFKVPPKVGFVARTTDPVPVAVVVPVPPIPIDKIPEFMLDALMLP